MTNFQIGDTPIPRFMKTPPPTRSSHCRSAETKKKLITRLRRIEGQTRALQKMVETDRNCIEILRLVSSVSGALRGVWTEVLNDHLKGCIRESLEKHDTRLLDELAELLKKSR